MARFRETTTPCHIAPQLMRLKLPSDFDSKSPPGNFEGNCHLSTATALRVGYDLRHRSKPLTVIRSAALRSLFSLLPMGQFALAAVNPSELLDRARPELLSKISRQSRYTCVQNIKRDLYGSDSKARHTCSDLDAGSKRTLIWSDRLELDVAIADNREIHSWPGASRFDEDEIRELVSNGGPFGSGDFGAFIIGIFGGSATVRYINSSMVGRRLVFEYAFDIPQSVSNYAIADPGGPS